MPVKKIFLDPNGEQQLEAYVNDKAKLYISLGPVDPEDFSGGYITLDRSDLNELIDHLLELRDEVFDESELESDD